MTTQDNLAAVQKTGDTVSTQEDGRETILGLYFVGMTLSGIGIACAVVGPFLLDGISIELLGMILGALGYCSGLQRKDVSGQVLGIFTIAVCLGALVISGITILPPQEIPLPGISSAIVAPYFQ
jgi:hypothetical protein